MRVSQWLRLFRSAAVVLLVLLLSSPLAALAERLRHPSHLRDALLTIQACQCPFPRCLAFPGRCITSGVCRRCKPSHFGRRKRRTDGSRKTFTNEELAMPHQGYSASAPRAVTAPKLHDFKVF